MGRHTILFVLILEAALAPSPARDYAAGWGFTALTGFSYRVFKKTSLFIEAGYRHLKTAPFKKDADESEPAADLDAPPLDLTGPLARRVWRSNYSSNLPPLN